LQALAKSEIVYEGQEPSQNHKTVFGLFEVAWFIKVDPEEETGQYQLLIKGPDGEPGLDVVQAMAATFFPDTTYEIMPEPKNRSTVRVGGLFFYYPKP